MNSVRTFKYGPHVAQECDLYLPASSHPPVVCLLHGGFWRIPYGKDQMIPVAQDLAARGYAVWNIEYRKLGEAGGGWPGTLQDVATAIDSLVLPAAEKIDLDLQRVIVAGHSAGGHLALWVSARRRRSPFESSARVQPIAAAGLAAMTDLAETYTLNAGKGATKEFLGGSPEEVPERYGAASPVQLLPLGVSQLILHGDSDSALPVDLSRDYSATASAAGDRVHFVELAGCRHMDYLDPSSKAHVAFCNWLTEFK